MQYQFKIKFYLSHSYKTSELYLAANIQTFSLWWELLSKKQYKIQLISDLVALVIMIMMRGRVLG